MNPGLGSMLYVLGGGSPKDPKDYAGRLISEVSMNDNVFYITFQGGVQIKIWDNAQSCCESRYMTTDDDPLDLVGKKLVHIVSKEAPQPEGDHWGEHDIVFIEIMVDSGHTVTLVNHNEHNGYYGGFGLSVDEVSHP